MKRRVLIAEDESITVMLLQRALTRSGYEVVGIAHDGEQAVALARETTPDFILMDITMPKMNGIEATRRIVAEHSTMIIMLTAYNDPQHRTQSLEAGACGYLLKPITRDMLIPALDLILDQGKGNPS